MVGQVWFIVFIFLSFVHNPFYILLFCWPIEEDQIYPILPCLDVLNSPSVGVRGNQLRSVVVMVAQLVTTHSACSPHAVRLRSSVEPPLSARWHTDTPHSLTHWHTTLSVTLSPVGHNKSSPGTEQSELYKESETRSRGGHHHFLPWRYVGVLRPGTSCLCPAGYTQYSYSDNTHHCRSPVHWDISRESCDRQLSSPVMLPVPLQFPRKCWGHGGIFLNRTIKAHHNSHQQNFMEDLL